MAHLDNQTRPDGVKWFNSENDRTEAQRCGSSRSCSAETAEADGEARPAADVVVTPHRARRA
jgi:hypothetical protein